MDSQPKSADDLTSSLSGIGRDPLDRLAEEFVDRCRNGESPSISEYVALHPKDADRVRGLLAAAAMMEQLRRGSRQAWTMPERLGEFRLLRELGRGGMGVVYEAVQESLSRHVAVKVIHHIHLNPKRLERFRREAQAVAQLHHTNIVPIFAVGDHEGIPYYAMQYIRGTGLDVLLGSWRGGTSAASPERWRLAASLGAQAAEALQYAHEQGVLHRDIKPANLLIDEHQCVWITDFGLAKLAGQDDLTASGDVIGTLRYLAPEALRGEADGRSDVYSLGLTLYELLTLEAPFGELGPSELLRQVGEGQPTSPRRLEPAIPPDLETVVLKSIARDPGHRYATAGELADDLRCFLEDRPIHARRAGPVERLWRWSRRNRAIASLTATAAGALLLAAVVGWIGYVSSMARWREADAATRRAEENVALSLEVFGELFERLASEDSLYSAATGGPGPPDADGPPPFDDGGPPDFSDGPMGPDPSRGPGRGPPGGGPPGSGPPGGGGGVHRLGMEFPAGLRMPPDFPGRGPGGGRSPDDGSPPAPGSENTVLLRSVLSFYDRFAHQNSGNPKLQGEAAWAYCKVGRLYQDLKRKDESRTAIDRAIAMFEDLSARFPDVPEYRFKLVEAYLVTDPWVVDEGDLARLRDRLRRAREIADRLAGLTPEDLDVRQAKVEVAAKLGAAWQRLGRPGEAEVCYRAAIELAGPLIEASDRSNSVRLDRVAIREALAILRISLDKPTEIAPLLAQIDADLLVLDSRHISMGPVTDRARRLADLYERIGDPESAAEVRHRAGRFGANGPGPPGRRPPRSDQRD